MGLRVVSRTSNPKKSPIGTQPSRKPSAGSASGSTSDRLEKWQGTSFPAKAREGLKSLPLSGGFARPRRSGSSPHRPARMRLLPEQPNYAAPCFARRMRAKDG